ncbi:MAG: phage terminase small subunit P27 family [Candidatus Brocadia sp. AMX2]|nr:MAG: phage terminase small subunit P27 family [Candidatus Brocadia sp. AMX2]
MFSNFFLVGGFMRRKPDKLKAMQGTYRQDRAKEVVDLPEVTAKPEPPSWLDDIGKKTWERVTAVMADANLSFDVELLSAFCDCYSHLIKCSEKLRAEGYTLMSDSGLELQKTLIEAGKQLGLSVESRARMGIEIKKNEPDELDFFLQGVKLRNQKPGGAK